jgi:hypothetical protein
MALFVLENSRLLKGNLLLMHIDLLFRRDSNTFSGRIINNTTQAVSHWIDVCADDGNVLLMVTDVLEEAQKHLATETAIRSSSENRCVPTPRVALLFSNQTSNAPGLLVIEDTLEGYASIEGKLFRFLKEIYGTKVYGTKSAA